MAAPTTPSVPQTTPSVRFRWLALAVLMLPVLLVSVDNTVLAFAIPEISAVLQPTSAQLLWLVDIYPLLMAALLVPMGSLADRYGRRRLLMIGGAGFAIVSVAAVLSPTAGYLIAARAGMAVFGATLMPSTLSLIRNIFHDAAGRRLAIAIWAAGFAAGAALGPIVGGFLLERFYWGSIFLMAVPILVPFLALAPWLLPESKDPAPGPIDLPSVALVIATMGPIVYGITALATGNALTIGGLEPPVIGAISLGAGVCAGAVFVRRQSRLHSPLIDISLFRNRTFRGSVVINLLSVFSLVGFLFFATQDLQLVMSLEPMAAALVLLPGLVATIVAGLLVVPLVARVRPAVVVGINFALAALGYGLVAFTTTDPGIMMVAFVVLGIGIGAGETVSNDLILANAPPAQAGAASAISETAYEVGAALGTAILGGLITAQFRSALTVPAGVEVSDAVDTLGGTLALAEQIGGSTGAALASSAQQAFASSAVITAGVGAALMIAASVYGAFALREARV